MVTTVAHPAAAVPQPLEIVLGLPLLARGPSYTCAMLARGMHGGDAGAALAARLHAPTADWQGPPLGLPAAPVIGAHWPRLRRMGWRWGRPQLMGWIERRLLDAVEARPDAMVWTFGEVPITLSRNLARRGVRVVREKFNCTKATAQAILAAEHDRLGLPPFSGISQAMLDKEAEELALATAVFSPSPEVTRSLTALGVPQQRILESSYGWEPSRMLGTGRALPPTGGVTLVFVGLLTARKGIHTLLEAWAQAGIRGRLVLAGRVDGLIAQRYGHILARPDVVHLGFVDDVASVLRSADWFVFPSLEEGSPLVTYEAAACGLPALVSPMGSGGVIRDGIEGVVLGGNRVADWAALIASLPARAAERDQMGAAARARAQDFTWDAVGARRRGQLLALAAREQQGRARP